LASYLIPEESLDNAEFILGKMTFFFKKPIGIKFEL
jgi:hypothetical protein